MPAEYPIAGFTLENGQVASLEEFTDEIFRQDAATRREGRTVWDDIDDETLELAASVLQAAWRQRAHMLRADQLLTLEFRFDARRAGRQLLAAWLSWKRLTLPARRGGAAAKRDEPSSWTARLATSLMG